MATPNNYRRPPITVTTDNSAPVTVNGSVDIATLPVIATEANPLPVLADDKVLEALGAMRIALELLASQSSRFMPDTSARSRVNVETGTVAVSSLPTLAAVTTVTTVTTTGTLTNQTNIGGIAANPQIPSLMMLTADNLRRNITVTP
jgi:hypothetical protein